MFLFEEILISFYNFYGMEKPKKEPIKKYIPSSQTKGTIKTQKTKDKTIT